VPLEAHRAVEYLLAFALASAGFSLGDLTIAAGGLAMIVPALTARGRFAILRWWPPAVHRVLDVLVVTALVLIPLAAGSRGVLAGVLLVPCAAVLTVLLLRTDYRERPVTRRAATPDQPEIDAAARQLGHLVGRAMKAGETAPRPSIAEDAPERVGRAAGELFAAARSRLRRRRRTDDG